MEKVSKELSEKLRLFLEEVWGLSLFSIAGDCGAESIWSMGGFRCYR
jgi:hypothetical protein